MLFQNLAFCKSSLTSQVYHYFTKTNRYSIFCIKYKNKRKKKRTWKKTFLYKYERQGEILEIGACKCVCVKQTAVTFWNDRSLSISTSAKTQMHTQNVSTCLNKAGKLSSDSALRMPFPPPPSEALIMTGKPIFWAALRASSASSTQPFWYSSRGIFRVAFESKPLCWALTPENKKTVNDNTYNKWKKNNATLEYLSQILSIYLSIMYKI